MPEKTVRLFVYGSLRPDGWNHTLIQQHVRSARPATVQGTLVDLGRIPALIEGDGIVRGTLLEVVPDALAITDRLEGVPHFYRRATVAVRCEGEEEVEAWVYYHADAARLAQHPWLLQGWEEGLPIFEWMYAGGPW